MSLTNAVHQSPETCAPRRPLLAVTQLALANFRSYVRADLELSGQPVVLAGPNGAGKTNLLDAISLLSPGRGLRGAQLGEHTRKAPQALASDVLWAVSATIRRNSENYEIGTGLVSSSGSERRAVHLNGGPAQNSADLAEIVQMVWLTPGMDRLFSDSASARRRFLDRLVLGFEPLHARRSLRYEQAMRERARLLRLGPRDPGWLSALEKEMAEAGIEIATARAGVVDRLNASLQQREKISIFPAAQLALEGETDRLVAENIKVAVETQRASLVASRMRDAEIQTYHNRTTRQRSRCSPHRETDGRTRVFDGRAEGASDLDRARQCARTCSIAGRARTAASVRRDRRPSRRAARAALFEEILALGAQAWLTGTDLSLFENLDSHADIFLVEAGQFTRQS